MDTHKFFVEKLRFHLTKKDTLVFVGWFFDGSVEGHTLHAHMDGTALPVEILVNRGAAVRQKYIRSINEIEEEVVGFITLPADFRNGRKLLITSSYGQERSRAYTVSAKKLCRLENEISYYIENAHRGDKSVTVTGWCMAAGDTKLELLDANGRPLQEKVAHYYRRDLASIFPDAVRETKPGFLVEAVVPDQEKGPFYLQMRNAEKVSRARIRKWDNGTKWQYIMEKAGDAFRYFERNGLSATLYKVQGKLRKKEGNTYDNWRKKYGVTPEERNRQREEAQKLAFCPKFSIVVPLYRTNLTYLREMIESICAQTYGNWELCMADGSAESVPAAAGGGAAARSASGSAGEGKSPLTAVLEEYAKKDARILYQTLPENKGISGNTNAALAMAEGDYIVFADHDDLLPEQALYELAAALNRDTSIDMLYSDEDKVSMDGRKYFEPHFKPDFNLDLLCSVNYICHLFAAKRGLIERAGVFRQEYDGAQDLDFILRCSELAENICHIPKILYHWRCHIQSTAANPESKLYAYEAGRRAVEDHYRRLSVPAHVEHARFYGMYRTVYDWKEEPLVSIIIPNKDHADDLKKCIGSVYEKSDYRNFEFVIVENNSTEPETFVCYKELAAAHENIHVVYYEGGFNYSKINNFGAAAAKGEYFLLLNNDTELIDGGCIRELLGYCMREDVGIVGAKLLYGDDTIQHAGVVVGFGGTAGHAFIGKARDDAGYFGRICCAQDYSAVTAACLMTKRSVYEAVGGLTEELAVAFNDVDYCLKVRELGKLVVYDPYAELHHYESKSRGYEDSPEKVERFNGETEILLSRWKSVIEKGDPYYNCNLTLDNSDFSLRR